MPAANSRIDFIDFGKGLSILSVVLFHYADASVVGRYSALFGFGAAGVHVFLVLAGFGLSLSPHSSSPSAFYRRRFVKILVPYYVFVTIAFLVNQVHAYYRHDGVYAYLGHLFWFKMFDGHIIGSFGGQLWFVSTILAFYLLFPLLQTAQLRLGDARFLALATVASVAFWIGVTALGLQNDHAVQRFFPQYLWEFCAGMVLASLYLRRGVLAWELPSWVLGFAVVAGYYGAVAVSQLVPAATHMFDDVPTLVGFGAAVVLAERASKRWWPRLHRAMMALGAVSFELFLVHMLVKTALRPLLPYGSSLPLAVVWLIGSIGASIAVAVVFRRLTQPIVRAAERMHSPAAPTG
ncbi:MAG: acyltransferase [Coriobacteriia bacterium]|nr:acyltransferase [Coriobacteriia bacterium]